MDNLETNGSAFSAASAAGLSGTTISGYLGKTIIEVQAWASVLTIIAVIISGVRLAYGDPSIVPKAFFGVVILYGIIFFFGIIIGRLDDRAAGASYLNVLNPQ